MNIIERAKNIIISPKTEWEKIALETTTMQQVIVGYVLPLAAIAAICTFIGYAFIGIDLGFAGIRMKGVNWGLTYAIIYFVQVMLSVIISSFVIDMLATSFGSEKNIDRSARLVGYGMTPGLIGAFLSILPMLSIIGSLFALYGLYLWYLGLGPVKKTPEDKKIVYIVVSAIVYIAIYFLISMILTPIIMRAFGVSIMPSLGL